MLRWLVTASATGPMRDERGQPGGAVGQPHHRGARERAARPDLARVVRAGAFGRRRGSTCSTW